MPELPEVEVVRRGLERHVGARAYGYSEVRTRERGGVVDPVPHHRHRLAGGLQLLNLRRLLPRQHLGKNPPRAYAGLPGYNLRGGTVVAG